MEGFAIDKNDFLVAIANTPNVSKTCDYEAKNVLDYRRALSFLSVNNVLSSEIRESICFAHSFISQFAELDDKRQQVILEILNKPINDEM